MSQILFNSNAGGGGGGGGVQVIQGDIGSVTGSTVSFKGLSTAGSSVSFDGSGTAMTFNVTDASFNTFVGESSGNSGAIGAGAANNTAVGLNTLNAVTSGSLNTAVGSGALSALAGAASSNTAIGFNSGSNYVTTESNNISIGAGVTGIAAESNTIRIGQDNTSGIQLINASSSLLQNFGSLNIFLGQGAGNFTLAGVGNVGVGFSSLTALTSGSLNVAMGAESMAAFQGVGSDQNVALGLFAFSSAVQGTNNVFVGANAGKIITGTSSTQNTCIGANVVNNLLTGDSNICLGTAAGSQFNSNESSNIIIGVQVGQVGDNNTIRIGATGTGDGQQNLCFIAGIDGSTVTGSAVLCDTNGQLGDIASSIAFKDNIQDMEDQSSALMDLRPVSFNYKKHPTIKSFGLIAEEVEKVMPDLVLYKNNEPYSIKYHEMPAMLLNEIQKLRARIETLEKKS